VTSARFQVVAFSGSVRAASSNTGLVHLAARLAAERWPDELAVSITDVVRDLPWYDEDLEAAPPESVVTWRDMVSAADALLLGMPEYNFGPSGLAKNAIDWLTRPPAVRVLQGKVMAMMTSGGKGGGNRVQDTLALILQLLGNTVVDEPRVQIAMGMTRIGADGATDDAEVIDAVSAKLEALVAALRTRA
jgi:chromate reductase, NAD(P)H dehydrogenase (quinone)